MEAKKVLRLRALVQAMARPVGQGDMPSTGGLVVTHEEHVVHGQEQQLAHGLHSHLRLGRGKAGEAAALAGTFEALVAKALHDAAQLVHLIGFQKEIKSRAAQGVEHVVAESTVKHDTDREREAALDDIEKIKSALAGHLDVEENDVRLNLEHGKGDVAARRIGVHFAYFGQGFQVIGQLFQGSGFVIDDKDRKFASVVCVFFHIG